MRKGHIVDYVGAGLIALSTGLVSWCVAYIVGTIAVAAGQGWDGSVFVRVIQEIAAGQYSNSDPYRAVRTSAFPAIYVIELFHMDADLVSVQRAFNIALVAMSTASLYLAARLKAVVRIAALLSCATFLFAWCVLVVPVFTPVLTDHLALFTSSISLLLWAAGRRFGLGILVFLCVWIMPTAALVPLSLLALGDGDRSSSGAGAGTSRRARGAEVLSILLGIGVVLLIYKAKGAGLFEGIETHSYDFDRNNGADLTGSSRLLPASILVVIGMLCISARCGLYFIRDHWRSVSASGLFIGLAVAALSFTLMRVLIDFDTGFSSSQLFSHITKQALSAPLKTWVAHFAYFGPVVFLVYYFVMFRRSANIPVALAGCLIGFLPLLATGSESRQWISVLPVIAIASAFVPISSASRVVMFVATVLMSWGVWHLGQEVSLAVVENVGLQHPLWHRYFGRVGPWMTMEVYSHWLAVGGAVTAAIVGAHYLQRARGERASLS